MRNKNSSEHRRKVNFGGIELKVCMTKVRKFAEITPNLPFSEFNFYELYRETFEKSGLGRMKKLLPLREMAESFGLVRKSMMPKRGRKSYFTPEGKVALMFLKMKTQMSFPKLMEELNGNIHYQMFCDILMDVEKANLTYRKQRKHTKSQTRKITRRLLDLLGKILKETRKMEREHEGVKLFTDREKQTFDIITKVYRQQHNHFRSGDSRESIPDRIVSVNKPYVRPIVRGKEVKSVEFGAKCNNILVDGISFIEKLSFNAFNEGTRLTHCIKMHKRLFGVDVKKIGGDASYAGNANREMCTSNGIQTSFVQKGKRAKEKREKDFVRQELARVRATAMEGSFGTQKEHYSLRRVKARKKETEILYIFFGIHTANVVLLAERLMEQQLAEAA